MRHRKGTRPANQRCTCGHTRSQHKPIDHGTHTGAGSCTACECHAFYPIAALRGSARGEAVALMLITLLGGLLGVILGIAGALAIEATLDPASTQTQQVSKP